MKYQVSSDTYWLDPVTNPPPMGTKIQVLSKYNVASIGTFQPDFHVGWYPLLKVPKTIKERIQNERNF